MLLIVWKVEDCYSWPMFEENKPKWMMSPKTAARLSWAVLVLVLVIIALDIY